MNLKNLTRIISLFLGEIQCYCTCAHLVSNSIYIYIISKMSYIFNVFLNRQQSVNWIIWTYSQMWIMQIMNIGNLTNIEIPVYLKFTNIEIPVYLKFTNIQIPVYLKFTRICLDFSFHVWIKCIYCYYLIRKKKKYFLL